LRWYLLILVIILFIPTVAGASNDPDSLWIDFQVELETPHRGSLSVVVRTGDIIHRLSPSKLSFPNGTGVYENDNLRRVLEVLRPTFSSNDTFFRSFLRSRGDLNLTNTLFEIYRGDNGFGFSFSTDFEYEDVGPTREYFVLTFSKWIKYPEVDLSDPLSGSRRDSFISEIELCRVHISVEPGEGNSMDLQFEDPRHERTASDETVDIHTDLHQVRSKGNGMKVSGFLLFSPGVLFPFIIIITILEIVAMGVIWWRNRFKGLGLILPILSLSIIPLQYVFYFNPHVNIYGTHDSFLLTSIALCIGMIAASFFVNPKYEKKIARTYEEEKGPSFEMPKVIYAEKNVYIRSKEGSGIDPYEILDVPRNMPTDEIMEVYRKQVLRFHPDKFQDSPEKIRVIAERETGRLNRAIEMILRERGEKD